MNYTIDNDKNINCKILHWYESHLFETMWCLFEVVFNIMFFIKVDSEEGINRQICN